MKSDTQCDAEGDARGELVLCADHDPEESHSRSIKKVKQQGSLTRMLPGLDPDAW